MAGRHTPGVPGSMRRAASQRAAVHVLVDELAGGVRDEDGVMLDDGAVVREHNMMVMVEM